MSKVGAAFWNSHDDSPAPLTRRRPLRLRSWCRLVDGFVRLPSVHQSLRHDAAHMTNDQWLGAMAKHVDDRSTRALMEANGAWQLADVPGNRAKLDPERFADLMRRIRYDAIPRTQTPSCGPVVRANCSRQRTCSTVLPAVNLGFDGRP